LRRAAPSASMDDETRAVIATAALTLSLGIPAVFVLFVRASTASYAASDIGPYTRGSVSVEYHATMESCSDMFHVDIPNVV
jgi:hypothetical protein